MMMCSFERPAFGPFGMWGRHPHPFNGHHQRPHCHRRPHPYHHGGFSPFARPPFDVLNTLGHLLDFVDSDDESNSPPTTSRTENKKNFEVNMNVKDFKPEELDVKMIGNFIVVEGKHEEKKDDEGFISRHFVRRYQIPADVNPEAVTCNFSKDGMLRLSAPRMIEEKKDETKTIPINVASQSEKTSGEEGQKDEEKEETQPASTSENGETAGGSEKMDEGTSSKDSA